VEVLLEFWPLVLSAVTIAAAISASIHALLYKRNAQAAVLWVSLIWFAPLVGPVLYLLLGINRIRRRASIMFRDRERIRIGNEPGTPAAEVAEALPAGRKHLSRHLEYMDRAVAQPLTRGNTIEPLVDGDEAFPAMLEAIAGASQSITLCSYIFDNDPAGREFAAALGAAVRRDVQVRVLVDYLGSRYSFPSIRRALRREGVTHARFMAPFRHGHFGAINLRNHRKILVVDGALGFTGGMNIRSACVVGDNPERNTRDIHFKVAGPAVGQLQEVFAEDWVFTTGEALEGDAWFPKLQPVPNGTAFIRAVADGPDDDFDKLRWALLGGLAVARRSVRIQTPYFLPDPALMSAINVAAMRGVSVELVLPEGNNLPFMHWAAMAQMWQVLEHGCIVRLLAGGFDHGKIMIVDDAWSFLGSANWDARSLRLNFEFNFEVFDEGLAAKLNAVLDRRLEHSRALTLDEVNNRPLPAKVRDGIARLFAPYL
jgi:cardiolipin synthase A/B